MIRSPGKSSTRMALESGIARTSVLRNSPPRSGNEAVPHSQGLSDKIARVQAAEVLLEMTNIDPNVVSFMSDEATVHVSGNVNKHNYKFR